MDRLSNFPQDVLQRIVYYLPQNEAVRTSILAKYWRYTGTTRPNLEFSTDDYLHCDEETFLSYVDKSLQVYCDKGKSLAEFTLSTSLNGNSDYTVGFLDKWSPTLSKLGVKKFHLTIRSISRDHGFCNLPIALFESESLKQLSVQGFILATIDFERIVISKNLRELCLEGVLLIEDGILEKIISNCRSIEAVTVKRCDGLRSLGLNDMHDNLKSFSFEDPNPQEICTIQIVYPSTIETITVDGGNLLFPKGAVLDFGNLKDLCLSNILKLDNFSPSFKFPSLQSLKISDCDGLKDSELFIDAPALRNFEYRGSYVLSISFGATYNEWKSSIYLNTNVASSLWLVEVKKLLNSVSNSEEISVTIDVKRMVQESISLLLDDNEKPIVVESLEMRADFSSLPTLVSCLFAICRPRYISHDFTKRDWNECGAFLWDTLIDRDDDIGVGEQLLRRGLEQGKLEMKEKKRGSEWRPAKLTKLMANPRRLHFRFSLKWTEM